MNKLFHILTHNRLFKDSFWAVIGNGMGFGLLFISGIFIARILGKDVYGEYGLIKTTMFYIASFASFGLQYTSTKYIAEYKRKNPSQIVGIAFDAIKITLYTSITMCVLLILFSRPLSNFINIPKMETPFRILGCLIIFRGLISCQNGILSGLGEFKAIAHINIISGSIMLALCIPLTYWGGLYGSLGALAISQFTNMVYNQIQLHRCYKELPTQKHIHRKKELVHFSLPVAIQEISYTICQWVGTLLIIKLSSTGELGLYTASSQWNVIVIFIPSLLRNVILSHLSSINSNTLKQHQILKQMLLVNLGCSIPPFILVCLFPDWIISLYGESFSEMKSVLQAIIFSAIFICMSSVLYSELLSIGKNWTIGVARISHDIFLLVIAYILISMNHGYNAAFYYAIANVCAEILYFSILIFFFLRTKNTPNNYTNIKFF